ncbi:site-specific integrase [Acetobacterium sp.]|uniref:tyrosine-type recombinase/integrase n=1 Tax=Acetobacterium sp. TaxID=1872094 RepID=UPI002F410E09
MASIKKVENKKGVVFRITVSNGYDMQGRKIKQTTTFTPDISMTPKQQERSANKFAMEFEDKVKHGACFDGEKQSFEEFAYNWLEYMKDNLTYSTYEGYKYYLENKMIPFFKSYKIAFIKIPLIEEFYKTMVDEYAHSTIAKFSFILSSMFSTAIRWQMIEINPCKNAILPKTNKEKPGIKYFTPQQSLLFLKSLEMTFPVKYTGHNRVNDEGKMYHINDYYMDCREVSTQYKLFFNIALFCGLRKSEALALHWNDIDFEKRIIDISKSVTKTEEGIEYKKPKTYSSIRIVSIPDSLIPLLRQYKAEYNQYRLLLGDAWKGDGNLFIQSDGKLMGRSTTYNYFINHIKRYNKWVTENKEYPKEKGLEELPMIALHGLRHSCATLLNYLGVNIIDISSILGHADTSTTMNIYAHSFEKQSRVASDKMDEFIRMHA